MASENCGRGCVDSVIEKKWCGEVEVVHEKKGREEGERRRGEKKGREEGEEYVSYLTCAATEAMSGFSHDGKQRAASM
jgi:O-acetyl-ADP-ribose deacetylase (regulator of RNase III)